MFAERLKALRQDRGYLQKDMARRIGITTSAYGFYEQGKTIPDAITLSKIAAVLETSTDYLLGTKARNDNKLNEKKGVRIPVLGVIHAGIPIDAITDIIDYEDISAEMAAGGEFFGLRVKGDSMTPVLLDGDTIIVRQQPDVENGETAIVSINGDEATVKRLKRNQDGSVLLIPNNPAYETLYFSREEVIALPVRVLGKVVEIRRKL